MPGSCAVVGDLCLEADWIARRLRKVRSSLLSSNHSGLQVRLRAEVAFYEHRCRQLLALLSSSGAVDGSGQRLERSLLKELLTRSLQQKCLS